MTKSVFILFLMFPNILFADVVKELSIGEIEQEFTVISEAFLEQEDWLEPVFAKMEGHRELASVFPRNVDIEESFELSGQLQVISEIPYTQPSQYRWALKKRVLRSLRIKQSKKKKTSR